MQLYDQTEPINQKYLLNITELSLMPLLTQTQKHTFTPTPTSSENKVQEVCKNRASLRGDKDVMEKNLIPCVDSRDERRPMQHKYS